MADGDDVTIGLHGYLDSLTAAGEGHGRFSAARTETRVERTIDIQSRDREAIVRRAAACVAGGDDLAVALQGNAIALVLPRAAIEIDRGLAVEAETAVEHAIGGETRDEEIVARLAVRGARRAGHDLAVRLHEHIRIGVHIGGAGTRDAGTAETRVQVAIGRPRGSAHQRCAEYRCA